MLITSLVYPEHAAQRLCQRNLSKRDVDYVCKHGSRSVRAGAIHVFLGKRNVPEADRRYDRITRLIGTTVLLDSHDARTVITAYRSPHAPRRDRRKAKYDRNSSRSSPARRVALAA